MLHIWISLCIKFLFEDVLKYFEDLKNLIILNILKEKLVMSCLLGSFYLKIISRFSNSNVQIAMISKVKIKFWSKFQFQIPFLQLHRTVEKVKVVVMVMVKSFDKYHHLFNLPILGTILLFLFYYFSGCFSWLRFKHTEYKET